MPAGGDILRVRIAIRGAVQGVGFRPFVYRLAADLGVRGFVTNTAEGVVVEAEGVADQLEQLTARLRRDAPPRAAIHSLEASFLDPLGYTGFVIRPSTQGAKTAVVLPDIATCPDCLREIFDPRNRRYRYPFTNCTNCGPRFSIIEALPYDRPNTTMRGFVMCPECRAEYEDPRNRRFHAQPNACPVCGPALAAWSRRGDVLAREHDALLAVAAAIREGGIVAMKGLGGFHLLCDARSEEAVRELRRRKMREEKPLALMYPSLDAVRLDCEVSSPVARLLESPECPIVLIERRRDAGPAGTGVASSVAPGNPTLGVMLPYTPLHHLLLHELGFPVVATSGNLSDEPICTDEHEALDRLGALADLFLVHDRPIARHVDDSVVRVMMNREQVVRRARGYAPLPVLVSGDLPHALGVGAHLKNTIAASVGHSVFLSQHIGDLETPQAFDAFRRVIGSFQNLYDLKPTVVGCDAHPNYLSTEFARGLGLQVVPVQHHYAHVLACMAENAVAGPVLGVAWDGTGYGDDGTVWGGEFLRVADGTYTREAHLRTFRLPGGDAAVKEPCRSALGLLHALMGQQAFQSDRPPVAAFQPRDLSLVGAMLEKGINAPLTSSAGRLFDAVAALVGLRQHVRFEGQAAMELEFALDGVGSDESYPVCVTGGAAAQGTRAQGAAGQAGQAPGAGAGSAPEHRSGGNQPLVVDWGPMIAAIVDQAASGVPLGRISAAFHNTLVEMIVEVARRVGEPRVVLSGGCFQNRYLTERAVRRLRETGFQPYWHQRIPPNDGGIAVGQIVAATRAIG